MIYSLCMNKATIVVFLLLFSVSLYAAELESTLSALENTWAQAYYSDSPAHQKQTYATLLKQSEELIKHNPKSAEVKIWHATILSANAAHQSPVSALSSLEAAKSLLEQAIKENPKALNGAAYVTLGTLYYMVPGWPVSFGDNQTAEKLLQASLKINPDGIDANYFYGDFLLQQDRLSEAERYLRKAVNAPIRQEQPFSDSQLQNQAKTALANLSQQKGNGGKNRLQGLFASADASDSEAAQ